MHNFLHWNVPIPNETLCSLKHPLCAGYLVSLQNVQVYLELHCHFSLSLHYNFENAFIWGYLFSFHLNIIFYLELHCYSFWGDQFYFIWNFICIYFGILSYLFWEIHFHLLWEILFIYNGRSISVLIGPFTLFWNLFPFILEICFHFLWGSFLNFIYFTSTSFGCLSQVVLKMWTYIFWRDPFSFH